MKETASMIPQLFYDLIGRVAPGAAVLLGAALLLINDEKLKSAVDYAVKAPTVPVTILLSTGFLASYLVGALLGGLAFGVAEWKLREGELAKIQANPPSPGGNILDGIKDDVARDARLSYVYDFIVLRDAAAGARLAKLRAEAHMCRVLVAGSILLALGYVGENLSRLCSLSVWLVVLVLAGTAFASHILNAHLSLRAQRLMVNCWDLLNKPSMT